jgi:hypothetical protein
MIPSREARTEFVSTERSTSIGIAAWSIRCAGAASSNSGAGGMGLSSRAAGPSGAAPICGGIR